MEVSNGSTGKYWIFFIVSAIGMALMTLFVPEWSWLSYPFVGTSLALALKVL